MKRPLPLPSLPLLILATASCDGSGSGDGRTSFDAFVLEQIETNTADDTEPVSLEGLRFRFDEDPDAFDELF